MDRGGAGDLLDNWAIFETVGRVTLTFDTYYDLEEFWGFGFVQVSTDGGATWTSLANESTTFDYDPNAHPKAIVNLPGLTGWSGDRVNMSYDGWYIDNVYVDGTLISDGSDASVFKDITEIIPINNGFTVTFVGMKAKGKGNEYKAQTMKFDNVAETGLFELNGVSQQANSRPCHSSASAV